MVSPNLFPKLSISRLAKAAIDAYDQTMRKHHLSIIALVTLTACGNDGSDGRLNPCRPLTDLAQVFLSEIDLEVDAHEVTNAQFRAFAEATGYKTRAERGLPEDIYSALPDEARVPGSAVFFPPTEEGPLNPVRWWSFVPGANWMFPEGPGSTIEGKDDHPVVHIAYEDAVAYAAWKGRRLPTAEEWEFAARGGLLDREYEWGDEEPTGTKANYWQGVFPVLNTRADGFAGLAPSACFPPNGYGLYDMTGNVWEWTTTSASGGMGIVAGGSYLCAQNYCSNYRPGSTHPQDLTLGTSHIGFRTVRGR